MSIEQEAERNFSKDFYNLQCNLKKSVAIKQEVQVINDMNELLGIEKVSRKSLNI